MTTLLENVKAIGLDERHAEAAKKASKQEQSQLTSLASICRSKQASSTMIQKAKAKAEQILKAYLSEDKPKAEAPSNADAALIREFVKAGFSPKEALAMVRGSDEAPKTSEPVSEPVSEPGPEKKVKAKFVWQRAKDDFRKVEYLKKDGSTGATTHFQLAAVEETEDGQGLNAILTRGRWGKIKIPVSELRAFLSQSWRDSILSELDTLEAQFNASR